MTKPKRETKTYFDFCECTAYIESKYKINTRDYALSTAQFGEWCNGKGYGNKDPKGKDRNSSQIWFAEFQEDIASGKVKERPYQDFWHWLTDVADIHRGAMVTLDPEMGEDAEPWQKEILGLYLNEFGTGPYLTDW